MKTIFTSLIILLSININAQKTWSLQDCFNYALENNISIKKVSLSQDFAKNTVKQSKMNLYLPSANANITEFFNFGNSIDPTTYTFVNSNTNSTRFGLNASYGLLEGLAKINTLKANKEKLSATEFEIQEVKNNIKIYITNLYLQIMIANDVVKIAKEKQSLTNNQYKNTNALVEAGIYAKGVLLDIEAQKANDELSILDAESNLEKALNKLKLLLQLDPYEQFGVQEMNLDKALEFVKINPQDYAKNALEVLPQIKAAEFRKKAAEYDLKIAKGSLFPSLMLSGYIGTNYFSEAQYKTGTTTVNNNFNINIGGIDVPVSMPQEVPIFSKTPFFKQLGDNLSESISLGLNIPILGGWQRRTAIANAKLNILKTELDLEEKQNKINEEVFNAYTDFKLAQKRYKASKKNVSATNEAYFYVNEKFKAGILNSLEFETAKNRKINAEANLLQAKFDLFFKKMILDYYKTGELKF